MPPAAPEILTRKQWCCLFDALSGLLLGSTDDAAAVWTFAHDGAMLHPTEVVDALVAWGLLAEVSHRRWRASPVAESAAWVPVESDAHRSRDQARTSA